MSERISFRNTVEARRAIPRSRHRDRSPGGFGRGGCHGAADQVRLREQLSAEIP